MREAPDLTSFINPGRGKQVYPRVLHGRQPVDAFINVHNLRGEETSVALIIDETRFDATMLRASISPFVIIKLCTISSPIIRFPSVLPGLITEKHE